MTFDRNNDCVCCKCGNIYPIDDVKYVYPIGPLCYNCMAKLTVLE